MRLQKHIKMTIREDSLRAFTKEVFLALGCSLEHAELAADVLVTADLRGIDSHGVSRLSGYIRLAEAGRINLSPNFAIESEALAAATVNADKALGLVSAPYAMDLAIQKAQKTGIGFVGVKNSNHFGIAAYHAMKALPHDMIGFALTNASPLVVPTYSKKRMLGTNPICMVFPVKNGSPIVIDMATSAAANGKLEIAEREGKSIPEGWLLNKVGQKTTNPSDLKSGGALLPLGSDFETGSHKGYGMGAMVDLLCGVLTGASFGPWVPPFVSFLPVLENQPGEGLGHMLGAFRIDAFRPKEDYYTAISIWVDAFKNAELISETNQVIIHGEPEEHCAMDRRVNGIPLNEKVYQDLEALSIKFGIQLIL